MADEQRLAVLEQHVRKLYEQIGALREELRTRDGVAPRRQPKRSRLRSFTRAGMHRVEEPHRTCCREPALSQRRTRSSAACVDLRRRRARHQPRDPNIALHGQAPDIDLEKLFGRYGTIAVASLAILMGVGTFLSWAIEHGLLGPTVRVVLGFVGAGIVAGGRALGAGEARRALRQRAARARRSRSCTWTHGRRAVSAGDQHGRRADDRRARVRGAGGARAHLRGAHALRARLCGRHAAPFVTAREPGSVVRCSRTDGW